MDMRFGFQLIEHRSLTGHTAGMPMFQLPCSNENKWEFFSLWEIKEKYDTYLQWRMDSGVMEESAEFLDGEPVWRFFNVENSY